MNIRKITASALAGFVLLSATACNGQDDNYNLECDRGDQVEHDNDCGYTDASNQWVWFSWVKQGEVSHSPANWEPPAGVQVQEDEEGSHVKKPKKKTNTKSTRR